MTISTISENTGATYTGVLDTTIYEFDPTSPSYNTVSIMEVSSKTIGDRGHVILEFTGISNITSTDTVSAVNLELNVITGTASQIIAIYELLTVPTYGQASWNNRLTATAWTTAGALNSTDANTTALETQTEAGNTTLLNFTSANLKNLVQTKVTAGQTLRLLICRSNDVIYDSSGVVFHSSEGTDTLRPKLTVTHAAGGGPTVSTVSSNSATEGSNVVHTVTLSSAVSGSPATYALALAGVTATGSGTDFTSALSNGNFNNSVTISGGTITVPVGVSSFTVSVPTTDDQTIESAETYTLTVGGVSGTGTINDNDAALGVMATQYTRHTGRSVSYGLQRGKT